MRLTIVGVAAALVGVWACNSATGYGGGGGGGANCASSGAAATVSGTGGLQFSPDSVTITAGQAVCWQNTGGVDHTVHSDTGAVLNGSLSVGVIFQHTFATGGVYRYHCTIHGTGMHGVVVVN